MAQGSTLFEAATEYWRDAAQRGVLLMETLNERGNIYVAQAAKTAPHVLNFPVEVLRDGRTLERGAEWSLFICTRCHGRAQRLRLLGDKPACGACVRASGLIYRSQSVRTEKRHAVTAPPRLARLNSDRPLRVHPWAGRTIDRRANLEFALRRSRIVARKHGVDRAMDQGF